LLRVLLKNIVPGISPDYSPYRIIKRDTAMKILTINKKYAFIDGYLGMVTDSFGYIDAEHHRRADGRSSYSYYRLLRHALMIAVYYGRRGRRR
jgi:undecaprenyl-phosphate 4-deoxy-4-formamido-L-arabinose transferase